MRWTAVSKSAMDGGLTYSLWRITAAVSGSMCSSPWQHGQVTMISFAIYSDYNVVARRTNVPGIQEVHHAGQCAGSGDCRDPGRGVRQSGFVGGERSAEPGDRAGAGQDRFFEPVRRAERPAFRNAGGREEGRCANA